MSTLLLVDDDRPLLRALRINLTAQGYGVVTASSGTAGLEAATASPGPDLVVLDLGLPDVPGLDVLTRLRGWSTVPVLVLSARTDSADMVAALDAGADDYLTKPFGVPELLARIRAGLRRASTRPTDGDPVITTPDFVVDLHRRTVTRDGGPVHLTPTEWGVLEQLARHRDRVVGHRELLREVWGAGYGDESHYLRIYLAHLRRKLEPDPARPRYLITEAGRGHRFVTRGGEGTRRRVE